MITALSALPFMWALNLRDSRAGTMLSAPDFKISPRLFYYRWGKKKKKRKQKTHLQIYKMCSMILCLRSMGSLGNDCTNASINSSSWKEKGLLAKRSLRESLWWCCLDPVALTGQFLMPTWILSQKTDFLLFLVLNRLNLFTFRTLSDRIRRKEVLLWEEILERWSIFLLLL